MFSKERVRVLSLAVLASVLSVGLAGCSENWNSIYRTPGGSSNVSVITDAKQRVILNVPGNGPLIPAKDSSTEPTRLNVVCAEPSPDVAQALSTALTLSAQATQGTQPAPGGGAGNIGGGSAGANFGLSTAASIAQLGERLAVVQLLRDKMYRACEAYANGAISNASYTLTLARFDKTMTTLLSAEMAAGAFGRKLAGVGGSAVSGGANAQQLMDANTRVAEAKAEHLKAPEDKVKLQAWTNAQTELIALLAKGMATSASGSVNADIGAIQTVKAVGGIAEIHRTYMDDSGVEPLIDTCLTTLSNVPLTDDQKKEIQIAATTLQKARVAQIEAEIETNTVAVNTAEQSLNDTTASMLMAAGYPFASFCMDQVLSGRDTAIIKQLQDGKTASLGTSLAMAKVGAIRDALAICSASTALIKDEGKRGAAAAACATAALKAMPTISAVSAVAVQ